MVRTLGHRREMMFDDTPRGILEALLVAGGVAVALSTAPVFLLALGSIGYALKAEDTLRRRKLIRYGSYLKTRNYISVRPISGKRVRVSLTPLGRRRALGARARRILSIAVSRPGSWDYKWRLILFDIRAEERAKRNAFRAFIRRIGAVMLQKSAWVHPFDCTEHVALLREHFNLSYRELRLLVVERIEEDSVLRRHFRL